MAIPYIGEIKIVPFGLVPKGWALCNGQIMSISQNQALFALLGMAYGGDGQTTFALPNLQGRVPMHLGAGYTIGTSGGSAGVALDITQLPTHTHTLKGTNSPSNTTAPSGNALAEFSNGYGAPSALTSLLPDSVADMGGSQPHLNMMPSLALSFIIALVGEFPSRN